MFHRFLISGNSNGIHSNLDIFSLGFFVVSAREDFNKIWIWLTQFCYWIKRDGVLGCNLNPVHAIFLTESALLRNADVGFSLSDMKKNLT